jgi:SnoaL-like domain
MTVPTRTAQELESRHDLLQKLQGVVDELEIRKLVAAAYLMADNEPDLAVYGANFAEDAVGERIDCGVPRSRLGARLVGRDAFLGDRQHLRGAGRSGLGSTNRHLITTIAVSIRDEGTTKAEFRFWSSTAPNRVFLSTPWGDTTTPSAARMRVESYVIVTTLR